LGCAHYWRKAAALVQASKAVHSDPARAEELKAVWELTEHHMRKAAHHAARFKRTSIAAGLGVPLLYIGWLGAKRA
jgi:hypothetical protein